MPLRCLAALCLLALVRAEAQPAALTVNTGSREEVRQFFRAVYAASENVPMGWTGSYDSGAPGDTSAAFKEATRLRVNFFRALAGLPADITFNPEYSAKAQQAALMMSGNSTLQHTGIPTNWRYYTAQGAEAANQSNLALGSAGPDSVNGYVMDSGANNAAVGHRRWLFLPQTRRMGTGDVPGNGSTFARANALWIIDSTPGGRTSDPRPPTRTTEVAYPPAGFVPHPLVWPRWSLSHPGANFSAATVTMTRDGQPVPVTLEPQAGNLGEPTLVWVYDGLNPNSQAPHTRPTADTTYRVTVSNVVIAGATRTFTYNVVVFDPDVAGADASPLLIAGTPNPALGTANSYAVAKPAFAPAFDWRTLQLAPGGKVYDAERGLDGLLATTSPGYEVVQGAAVANGRAAYRLAHAQPGEQILQLPETFLVSAESVLSFQSRLGIATSNQTAQVQVSADEGRTWIDVFTQRGTSVGNPATQTEAAFTSRLIPLAPFAGRTLAVRLNFSVTSGSYFPPTATTVGWFIDNLTVTNAQTVTAGAPNRVTAGSSFGFAPTLAGPVGLQARLVLGGAYPSEWGPVFSAVAAAGSGSTGASYLANLSVRTTAGSGDNTLIVGFAVSGGPKRVLVRGVGPALAAFGVGGTLPDPRLELFGSAGKVGENDNWDQAARASFGAVGAFDLANGSRDAVLLQNLAAESYTAQLSGNGGSGIALVELYDTAGGAGSRLANVSARSQVGTGDNILVAGFNVAGTGARTLLIRAVGPMLTAFGVSGALADPQLELFESGRPIAANDNWDPANEGIFGRVGAFALPRSSRDAVLVVTLPPGTYTAQVSGVGGTTGVALVEVYEVP